MKVLKEKHLQKREEHNKSLNATPMLCVQLSPCSKKTVMADCRLAAR